MNTVRKLIGLLFLVAIALPASAQNNKKQFTLNITAPNPAKIDAGAQSSQMTFAVANVSPDGVSTIKSFKISVPSNSGIKIKNLLPTSPSVQSGFTGTVNVDPNGTYVTVDAINPPIKPFDATQGTLYLNLKVDVPCTFSTGDWTANVYPGTPQSGQQFVMSQDSRYPSKVTLNVGTACAVTVTATANPTAGGSVNCPSPDIYYGSTTAKCTAAAASGYRFTGFSDVVGFEGCLSTSGLVCTLSNGSTPLIKDKKLVANFAANTLTMSGLPVSPAKATISDTLNVKVDLVGPAANVKLTSSCGFTGAGTSTTPANSFTFTGTIPTPGSCIFTASQSPTGTDYPTPATQTVSVISGTVNCTDNKYVATKPGIIDPDYAYLDLNQVTEKDYGIRRGPNTVGDPATCPPVDVSLEFPNNSREAHFTYDKSSGQAGNFKYMIVWGEVPVDAAGLTTGWTNKRPNVAWVEDGSGNPVYVPALACVDDQLGLGSGLMPVLPSVAPFDGTGASATHPEYLADGSKKAKMCIAQHGWRSMNRDPAVTGPIVIQYWSKIIDQADGWVAIDQ
jgi:hypothetical protein